MAPGPPVDRWSLSVEDDALVDSRPLSLWRPFACLDQGAGAACAAGPVDPSLRVDDDVHALAVLRVFDADWDCPGAGHCELVAPLAEVVGVGGLAVPWVAHADWRGPGTGDWAVAGGSLCPVASPLADGTEEDQAVVLAAAERVAQAD